jgi:hypothetical protein
MIVVAIWANVATRAYVTVTWVRTRPRDYERLTIRKFKFLNDINLFIAIYYYSRLF